MAEFAGSDRAAQKEASRKLDRDRVRLGLASAREINQANGVFTSIERENFKIVSVRGKSIECSKGKG